MTFEQAIERKKDIGETIIDEENDITMQVFIAPSGKNEFDNFVSDYRMGDFTDYTARKYTYNNSFMICSLWSDGSNVLYKILVK